MGYGSIMVYFLDHVIWDILIRFVEWEDVNNVVRQERCATVVCRLLLTLHNKREMMLPISDIVNRPGLIQSINLQLPVTNTNDGEI
jgi:hypothetical protein